MRSMLTAGEGPAFTLTTDEVEVQADHCNKKKKSAKVVEVNHCAYISFHLLPFHLYMCMYKSNFAYK